MAELVDVMHLGRDRVIGAWEIDAGVVADPGPASCVETLVAGLRAEPHTLLLTHIHLDHAGAAGVLARRFPRLRVHVHESAAPHLADPSRLVRSAARLYGPEMQRLWGEVAPVPAERLVPVDDGDRVAGCRVLHAPGHAASHVVYLDERSGDAVTGDVAGVRIPPAELTMAPTPPPEIDVDAWLRSLEALAGLEPRRLCLTHFGAVADVAGQLELVGASLRGLAALSRGGERESFTREVEGRIAAQPPDIAARLRQAMPPEQLWLGLERYWRKRRERLGDAA